MKEINIRSSTVEKSLELAKEFLQAFIKPSIEELGLFMQDGVKLWRLKNQIKTLEKVKSIVASHNVSTKQISLKILLPYLDGVSLEEDDMLQDMWANLLVNYIDSQKNLTLNVYPNILKQLSTNEVTILKYMKENSSHINDAIAKSSNLNYSNDVVANLERLGLISEIAEFNTYDAGWDDTFGGQRFNIEQTYSDKMELTNFGHEFMDACKR